MEKTTIMLDDEETRLLAVLSTKEPGTEEYQKILLNAECVHNMKIKADESEIKNGLEIEKNEREEKEAIIRRKREEKEAKFKMLGFIGGALGAATTIVCKGIDIYMDRKKWVEMCIFEENGHFCSTPARTQIKKIK